MVDVGKSLPSLLNRSICWIISQLNIFWWDPSLSLNTTLKLSATDTHKSTSQYSQTIYNNSCGHIGQHNSSGIEVVYNKRSNVEQHVNTWEEIKMYMYQGECNDLCIHTLLGPCTTGHICYKQTQLHSCHLDMWFSSSNLLLCCSQLLLPPLAALEYHKWLHAHMKSNFT